MFAGNSENDVYVEQVIRKSQDSPALRSLITAWSKLDGKNQEIFLKFVESFVQNYQDNDEKK